MLGQSLPAITHAIIINWPGHCCCEEFCLFLGFTAQTSQWGHVECGQFT